MKWTVRSVYFYLVSFVMLLTFVFGSVGVINSVIDFLQPDYAEYQLQDPTNELRIREELRRSFPEASADEIARWAADRVQQAYSRDAAVRRFHRWAGLIRSAVLVAVALPVYLYHWRRAQRLADD